ncbi:hypothetical protein [Arsukibacterium perlucidum]|nr:hypothetical protein [Arsukibacterium perlucidum]
MQKLLCGASKLLWSVAKPANLHNYLHECATDYHLSEWFDE